ncbi:Amiloride-sensitive sodium channel [Nesidiocoris tenuis]|uniref:Amiloride-sensitive sodium channel n=1 Tax=Nesidiocoris tenuis TaxID=355587 RepID=A0ABN7AXZ8_9HEMI|nr:Amiloride-sensitive sodium channel [Nesidiocoris tenuis]
MRKIAHFTIKIFGILGDFFGHTSLHGLKFIAERDRHWSERLLWTALCTISWIGFGILFKISHTAFQEDATRYEVDTNYLQAQAIFPFVTVCEYDNPALLLKKAEEIFGEEHGQDYVELLRELTYFRGTAPQMKANGNNNDIMLLKGNFSGLAKEVRMECDELFSDCFWNDDDDFDCCKHFLPTETELGPCFTFSIENEKLIKDRGDPDWVDVTLNERKQMADLMFDMTGAAKVYLHSQYDVPYLNTAPSHIIQGVPRYVKMALITFFDLRNAPEVRQLSVNRRKCRFPDENDLKSADFYSYSACILDCRRKAQMYLCNCTSHFTPKSKPEEHCDYNGIICLHNHSRNLLKLKTQWSGSDGLACDCLPSCEDNDFDINIFETEDMIEFLARFNHSGVSLRSMSLPSEIYRRIVVRGVLDLVVSIGGAAGLFVGASLLTVLEVTYYFVFRSKRQSRGNRTRHEDEVAQDGNGTVPQGLLPFVL